MAESPLFNAEPKQPMTCPRCGRVFEVGFRLDGSKIMGHPVGHPKLCELLPNALPYGGRDARLRKEARRGR